MLASDIIFRYIDNHPNVNTYDLKSLKDFIKDIIFSIKGAEDNPDPVEGTVIVY
jgi:hypothetical protein